MSQQGHVVNVRVALQVLQLLFIVLPHGTCPRAGTRAVSRCLACIVVVMPCMSWFRRAQPHLSAHKQHKPLHCSAPAGRSTARPGCCHQSRRSTCALAARPPADSSQQMPMSHTDHKACVSCRRSILKFSTTATLAQNLAAVMHAHTCSNQTLMSVSKSVVKSSWAL